MRESAGPGLGWAVLCLNYTYSGVVYVSYTEYTIDLGRLFTLLHFARSISNCVILLADYWLPYSLATALQITLAHK